MSAAGIVAIVAVANLIFLAWNASRTRAHELRLRRDFRREQAYADFAVLMHHTAAVAEGAGDPDNPIRSREISEGVGHMKAFASDAVLDGVNRWAESLSPLGRVAEMRKREKRVLIAMRKELDGKETKSSYLLDGH